MLNYPSTYNEDEKLWYGPRKDKIFNENISVGEVALFMMRSKNPQDIMQISDSENTTLTYGQALTYAIRIAQYFKQIQLTADDTVGIMAPNTTYVMPVALAAWFNGTPFQPMSCNIEMDVIKNIYESMKPKIIFCDGLLYEKVKMATLSFKTLIYTLSNHLENVPKVEDLFEPTNTEHYYQAEPLKYGSDQVMAILYSSGTNGEPKGVRISNKFCSNDNGLTDGSDVICSISSLSWLTGFVNFTKNVLLGGTRIITAEPFSAENVLKMFVKYKISVFATDPSVMSQISLLPSYTKEAMKHMRLITMGGSQCSETILKRIRSGLTVGHLLVVYGSTEVGAITRNASGEKANSVGKLVPNLRLKIVDVNTGERLGPNQTGEICATDGRQWLGYHKNPEASKATVDSEGYVCSGDLGYMDDEHYLYVVDRRKDILKFKNAKYSPTDIEKIITEIPDVIDVCVFGVYDEVELDVPAAAVVKKEGSSLTQEDIIKYLESKHEEAHKRIHYGVFFLKQLYRNNNGKLMRTDIQKMCLAMEKENKLSLDR